MLILSYTVAALFLYLSHYPRVYNKAINEILSVFDCLDIIKTGPKLSSCTYFQAAIMEALRMSAPGSTEHPRKVLPGGLTVGDAHFPAGTVVGSSSYAFRHSVTYYVDPFVFRPERWIVGDGVTAEDVACAESAFYGFSLGPKGYPGKTLAWMELQLLLARVLWRHDIRLASGDTTGMGREDLGWGRRDWGQYQAGDAVVGLREAPFVRFRRRDV